MQIFEGILFFRATKNTKTNKALACCQLGSCLRMFAQDWRVFIALKKRIPLKMCFLSCFVWLKAFFLTFCVFLIFFFQSAGSQLCFRFFWDTVLSSLLVLQIGEKDWQNMSERERQRRLMELKLKERQLRRDGKFDELAALLGMDFNSVSKLSVVTVGNFFFFCWQPCLFYFWHDLYVVVFLGSR